MTIPTISGYLSSKIIFSLVLVLFFLVSGAGQELKKMTPDVYSSWNRIKNTKISDSAETILYTLEKETGNKWLAIYNQRKDTTFMFSRVIKADMDMTGSYVLFTHGLDFDSTRVLKRKKTPKDKMPIDSLTIFNTVNNRIITIAGVTDFTIPARYSGYCVYTKKMEVEKADTTVREKVKKPICDGTALFIRNLVSGQEDTIKNSKDFSLADESPKLAYVQCSGDSTASYSVYTRDLNTDTVRLILADMYKIDQLSYEKSGKSVAFLGLKNKTEVRQKPYQLYLKSTRDTLVQKLNLPDSVALPAPWVISSDRKLTFSESGNRLFFGLAPVLPIKDTTLLDDEIVNVEIWHHDSPRLYTQMESTLDEDKKKSYAMMYDIGQNKFLLLESPETEKCITSVKGDGKYMLQLRSLPYQKVVTWNGELFKDLILLDTETGNTTLISQGESGDPAFSPGGRYIYWWKRSDSIWQTFDTQKFNIAVLGLWSVSVFHDEKNDIPQKADAYGFAGWLKNDEAALVYDRYDIWKLNPEDPFTNINLTGGRSDHQVYRYMDTDMENEYIDGSKDMLLHRFDEQTKEEAYLSYNIASAEKKLLTGGAYSLTKSIQKARNKESYLFTKQNFSTFPDLLVADTSFVSIKKISDANPQQKEYGWGTAKLFSWTNFRGQKNEGMLFFPPNFDMEKKYPLLVNFYERSSDELHRHRAPEAHRSSINYTYYTNQGYVIFNPDIHYTKGQPGEDCYNAVESGVDALLKEGFIDESRMGLQGHSWGGYQIAYLLTKTNRYRCAEAGAPVVNMVSAYGGIRWESGMSRMFQYEKTQSRLGATLWDDTSLFHKNSPIYSMTKVQTPVLILHNDEDGAVPWQQGIEYFMALRRLNKETWMLNYNGEPHWPVKWQNRLDFNIRLQQYFDHYLMDKPKPLWMKEGNTPIEKGILNKY